jgi:predicted small secreted protein
MKKVMSIAALFGASVALAGCNTMEGFGKDLQAAGTAISGSGKTQEPAKTDSTKRAPAPAPAPAPAKPTNPTR